MKFVLQVFAGDFAAKLLLGAAALALIRFLPANEYAVLTLATVLSAFVVQGMTGNLNQIYLVGRKSLRLEQSPQLFLAMELWLIALISVVGLPLLLFGAFFEQSDHVGVSSLARIYALIVGMTVANCLLEFAKTFYQQKLRFVSFSLIEIARTALFVLCLVGLIIGLGDRLQAWHLLLLHIVCVGSVLGVVFGMRVDWLSLLQVREIWRLGVSIFSSHYLLMIGYTFGVAMLVRIDVMMLTLLSSGAELATFGASFRYYSILMVLLTALHTVFLPLIQQIDSRGELSKLFIQHRWLVFFILPIIAFGAVASGWLIPLIDGGKYPGAISVFRILSLSAVISLMCSPYANLLFRYKDFRFLFTACLIAVLANCGMNAVLIPHWHSNGAAWTTLVASGGMNLSVFFRARTLLAQRPLPALSGDTLDAADGSGHTSDHGPAVLVSADADLSTTARPSTTASLSHVKSTAHVSSSDSTTLAVD